MGYSICKGCGRKVSAGVCYCHDCWNAEIEKYKIKKAEYDAAISEWKSLSPEEQAERNGEANNKSLKIRSFLLFLILAIACASVGYFLNNNILYGCAIVVFVGGIVLTIKLFKIFGRIFAVLLGCVVGAAILGAIAYLGLPYAAKKINIDESKFPIIFYVMAGVGLVLGGFIGFRHKAKVKIKKPVMPSNKGNSITGGDPNAHWL